jgi:hypothetical protein
MLGLRNLARSAPRSAARLSTKAVRPQSSVFRNTAAFQPAWTASVPRLTAAFHVSARKQQSGHGKSDRAIATASAPAYGLGGANSMIVSDELVAKLQSEISMEEDMKEDDDLSANIKEYLENSPFEVPSHTLPIVYPLAHTPPDRRQGRQPGSCPDPHLWRRENPPHLHHGRPQQQRPRRGSC